MFVTVHFRIICPSAIWECKDRYKNLKLGPLPYRFRVIKNKVLRRWQSIKRTEWGSSQSVLFKCY